MSAASPLFASLPPMLHGWTGPARPLPHGDARARSSTAPFRNRFANHPDTPPDQWTGHESFVARITRGSLSCDHGLALPLACNIEPYLFACTSVTVSAPSIL